MQKLAAWAIRFTPAVSLEQTNVLLLDVHASLKCFDGFPKLLAVLRKGLADWGYTTAIGCAPTALAALWLARSGVVGQVKTIRQADSLRDGLGGVSIACLCWPDSVQRTLMEMGITTLGACMRLPRGGLARHVLPTH